MSRVEIGHDKVQATDYAYTIQGWIKGVNSNILNAANDIGKDGNSTTTFPPTGSGLGFNYINAYNARDAFAHSLTYFNSATNKDYRAINGTTGTTADFVANTSAIVPTPDLFNGNIRQMVTTYLDANAPSKTYTPLALLKNYTYDQLNRIATANANNSINLATNSWNTSATVPNMYNENFIYDQNGNILNASRNGNLTGTLAMDNLTYNYIAGSNKLDFVSDAVSGTPYGNDFPSGQSAGNYAYDKIGNLIKDTKENITNIAWTVYGKIKQITKTTSTIGFAYDASGNRVSKRVVNSAGDALTTYYVRDAQGNVMATYEENDPIASGVATTFAIKEQHLYGSSRIGIKTANFDPSPAPAFTDTYTRSLGFKNFELTNHLGNVITVITDRKLAHTTTPTSGIVDYFSPEIVSSNDYYAFGMPMPGRSYQSSNGYRYGMNGQEKDLEIFEGAMTAEYWEYDSRLGRRWNTDPIDQISESNYSCFGNNPVLNTDVNGDFKTKFGAKLYAFFKGGEVFKDKGGEYGVNQSTSSETDVTIRPNAFDWSGRSEGRDLKREANLEKVKDILAWEKELNDPKSMYSRDVTQEQGAKNAINLGLTLIINSPLTKTSTSANVIETTAHGAERITGVAATRGGVLTTEAVAATKALGKAITQADGATVYLHEVSPGRFNAVVEGTKGVITTMANWSQKSITRIAKNYGWKLE